MTPVEKAKLSRAEKKSIIWLNSMGYRCTRMASQMAPWSIMGISGNDTVLLSVTCNSWPDSVSMAVMGHFPVPENTKKLVWRWDDHQREPLVRKV